MSSRMDWVGQYRVRHAWVRVLGRLGENAVGLSLVLLLPLAVGCGSPVWLRTPARLERGLTIILPGVEGRSWLNTNIAKGLADGGVPSAIEVYDWTIAPLPVIAIVNLRATGHNLREARRIAQKIVNYQDQYPGRPVHLIGHSGGGGIAVFALESLPPNHPVSSAILLAPALSRDYDLRRALRATQHGLWNYYSPHDVGFLKVGTTMAGTIDGQHTRAAGADGFSIPWGLSREDRQLYGSKLHQQCYTPKMAESGHSGSHFGWANRTFVAEWLAPLVYSQVENHARYAADQGTE